MKHIIRAFLFNVFALWFASQLLPTIVIPQGWQAVILAGFTLSMLMLIVKPILKILFIPINIMTFGLLSWMINVIVMYLLTLIDLNIRIIPWSFPGFTFAGFVIPSMEVTYLLSLIVSTFVVTFIINLLKRISED